MKKSASFDPPASRCPSCLASRQEPGGCQICGWGTAIPRFQPEPRTRGPATPMRSRSGVVSDLGRMLDAELGVEGIE